MNGKFFSDFNRASVRPEALEGRTEGFSAESLVSSLKNSPQNYRLVPCENLPFPSLRLGSGHAFSKRGQSLSDPISPFGKG
jgi:hypothetical protein